MRRLLTAALVVTLFGALLAGPATLASAQRSSGGEPVLEAAPVPVTGTTDNGGTFEGEFALERFKTDGETLYAVGMLTGTLEDPTRANGRARAVSRRVSLPVTGATAEPTDDAAADATAASAAPDEIVAVTASMESVDALPVQTQQVCNILNLDLGPLDLNLLGLRVQLNEINLDITAVPGAGNLLGNLLCAVAGLLDPIGGGGGLGGLLSSLLQGIVNLLNQLLGGLGGGL